MSSGTRSSGANQPGANESGANESGANDPGTKERRAPLQSPLRRNPNGGSAKIVRPPQFAPDRDDDTDIVAHLSRVLDSMSGAAPTVAKTPPQGGDGGATGPVKPTWVHTAPSSVPVSPRPAPPGSSSNGGRPKASNPGPSVHRNPSTASPGPSGHRNPGATGPNPGPSGPGSLDGRGPSLGSSDPDGRGSTLVPDEPSADFGPIAGGAGSDKAASGPAGYRRNADPIVNDDTHPGPAARGSDAGPNPTTNRFEGYGRPTTGATAFSGPPALPESLKAFAPGAPDTQMEVAAIVGSPRWRPGDDDVLPGDGRKGLRRPRLRDRFGI